MKSLGKEYKDNLYPTMAQPNKSIIYPHICLSASLFSEGPDIDEVVELHIKCKVTGIMKNKDMNEVDMDILEGEVIKEEEPTEK